MPSPRLALSAAVLCAAGTVAAALPLPAAAAELDCQLRFNLSGWSIFYKTASGSGTVTCNNGQSMAVNIRTKGGGVTVGKTRIEDGTGEFAGVSSIDQVLGSYANAEAHAGVGKSSGAQVMTNGEVSLALAGTGKGWNLGISFGKFVISR